MSRHQKPRYVATVQQIVAGEVRGESSLPTSDCQLSSVLSFSFTDLNLLPYGCPTVPAVPDNFMLAALPVADKHSECADLSPDAHVSQQRGQ